MNLKPLNPKGPNPKPQTLLRQVLSESEPALWGGDDDVSYKPWALKNTKGPDAVDLRAFTSAVCTTERGEFTLNPKS